MLRLAYMLPVKLFTIASIAVLLQSTLPVATDVVGPIERLTLVGSLVVAVRVLWVSNKQKDDQIASMVVKVTETMALALKALEELRKSNEALVKTVDELEIGIEHDNRRHPQ